MTFHAANFHAQWSRETSEGGQHQKLPQLIAAQAQVATFVGSGTGVAAPLTVPEVGGVIDAGPTFCERIEAVELVVENNNGDRYTCIANRQSTEWTIISSVAGDVGVFANNALPAILQPNNPFTFPAGQPNGAIFFDGAALAAFDAGAAFVPVDIVEGKIWISDGRGVFGVSGFSEFVDIPPDTSANRLQALDRLNRQFRNAKGRANLGVTAAGATVFANDCDLALLPCSRRLFIRASDIGNQNEQIPSNIENNTPAHFRFFPQTFFRRSSYVRGVVQSYPDAPDGFSIIGQNNDFQPYGLLQVQRAPDRSAWRILVDGALHEVWVGHPAGSDFRTGLEIWNGVWAPAVQANEAVLEPLQVLGMWTRETVPATTAVEALIHRLRYLQYAELLEVSDGQTGMLVPFPQGNAGTIN